MDVTAEFEGGPLDGKEVSVTLVDGAPPARVGDYELRPLDKAAIERRNGEATRYRKYDFAG